MRRCSVLLLFVLLVLRNTPAHGQAAAPSFDLIGPKVDVHVKRGEVTLPIGQVPNLLPGDRLWIHPDLPESQSDPIRADCRLSARRHESPACRLAYARGYLGQECPRPRAFSSRFQRRHSKPFCFCAPSTGGRLQHAAQCRKGRPGTFVRATQDLQAASLDRMRLDAYLAEVKVTSQTDPKFVKRPGAESCLSVWVSGWTSSASTSRPISRPRA